MNLYEYISSSHKTGIFSHMNPDGDALGCCFAMASYVKTVGRDFVIFLPCQISDSLQFMIPEEMKDSIRIWNNGANGPEDCDLLVGVDFNVTDRIGGWGEPFKESTARKILIDHHLNPQSELFDLVHSKTEVSSACELLYSLLKDAPEFGGRPENMPAVMRSALMTGMTTDTNNFANSVFPSTLEMASELLACGTDRNAIIQKLYFSYPMRRIKAQGYVLDKLMKVTPDGVAYIILDWKTQKMLDLQEGDTEGFVNIPLSAADVRMSLLLKQEESSGKVRVSIRSKEGTSAQQCAVNFFHGGGHELASGGRLNIGVDVDDMSQVEQYVIDKTHIFLNK